MDPEPSEGLNSIHLIEVAIVFSIERAMREGKRFVLGDFDKTWLVFPSI